MDQEKLNYFENLDLGDMENLEVEIFDTSFSVGFPESAASGRFSCGSCSCSCSCREVLT